MANLSTFLKAIINLHSSRGELRLIANRKPKRNGWYWPIVISLVYYTLLISLTNIE